MADKGTSYETSHFNAGDRIFKEGDKGRCAYLVKSGRVDLYRTLNNQEMSLGSLEAGAIFGEMAVITGETRTATALAGQDTELVVLDRGLINRVLESSPPLMQKLVNLLFERIKSTTERLAERPRREIFLSVCTILDMMLRSRAQTEGIPLAQVPGVNYQAFLERAKRILAVTTLEIGEELDKVTATGAAEIAPHRSEEGRWEHVIYIHDPDNFLTNMENVVETWSGGGETAGLLNQPFLDLSDFAEAAGVEAQRLRELLQNGQLPETLVFLPRDSGLEWAQGPGRSLLRGE
jgi:CRP-like cAMP-binding protein